MEWIRIISVLCLLGFVIADQCPVGNWVKNDGWCYLFSSQKLKFQEAIDECQKYGSDVSSLQFFSKLEKDYFLNMTVVTRFERWWTTLNDLKSSGTFVWGTTDLEFRPDDGIVVWNLEPDDTKHLENCAAINIQATVSDEDCSERHGYICEHIATDDGCLADWTLYNNSCYYISDTEDSFSNIRWSDAKTLCTTLAPNKNAHLLQLETKIEQGYLMNALPFIQTTSNLWWIGMTDQAVEGRWMWVDGTLVNQQAIQWEVEPDNLGGNERCAMLYNSGVFTDRPCDDLAYYVCKAPQKGDNILLNKVGCPPNWVRGGQKCYLFQTNLQSSWSGASSSCRSAGGRLVQVETKDEETWIDLQTRYYRANSFWSGLTYHKNEKTWYWSTGIQANMNYIKWNSEPNNFAGNEDCAQILQDGTFNDNNCLSKLGYICEIHPENAPCPKGWKTITNPDFNSCYLFSNRTDLVTWEEGIEKCKQQAQPFDGALLALNSKDEVTKINQLLQKAPQNPIGWWTGLNDRTREGMWTYYTTYDNPYPANIINWNTEPSNPEVDSCAVIYFGGRYNDVNCQYNLSYICESDAQQGNSYYHLTSQGLQYLPFYLNTAIMVLICWLY